MQQPSDLLCNWTAASSPDMSEIDDNENDAGFGGPIARLRPNGFAGDEFDGIPEDLKHIEAFGRDSFGGMGNMNGEQSSHGNNGAPFQASSSQLQPDFRAHIKIEPQPLAAGPTGTRMGQDFRFQEAEDSSMHIHHDLMFRRIIQDIFTTCSSLCLPTVLIKFDIFVNAGHHVNADNPEEFHCLMFEISNQVDSDEDLNPSNSNIDEHDSCNQAC
uniref:Rad21_Rec8 domain-containing protein n=1 Tax=Bursaphelenchus xylophilus TaxID=6326 RepID=A0A1I7RVG8_BURXY